MANAPVKNVFEVLVSSDGVESPKHVIAADLDEGLRKAGEFFEAEQVIVGIKFICKIDLE